MINHSLRSLIKSPIHFFAFGFGSGLINPAPGTWGTLAGTLIFLPFASFLVGTWVGYLLLIISFVVGIYFCDKTAKDIGVHDFGGIVWDEFVGVWLVLVFLPDTILNQWGLALSALAAFALFRFFDILKPPPIGWVDTHVTGGFGIMVDDIIAGIFALIVLLLLCYFV